MDKYLHSWADLQSTTFKGQKVDLLLGNGFSRRYSDKFAYDSLFQVFLKNCDKAKIEAFKVLGTDNFEEILDFLTKANDVNSCLTHRDPRIDECIDELKKGLIKTVNDLHPLYGQLDKAQLDSDATALIAFEKLFTTNYDLILYHAIMLANDKYKAANNGERKFQDNFSIETGRFLDYNWYRAEQVNVHYLHGSLILFTDDYESTYKIRKTMEAELLESVDAQIRGGDIPLFVSEGEYKKKESTIRSNQYLSLCFV